MGLIINGQDVGNPPATNNVGNTRTNYTLIQNLQAQINALPVGGGNIIGTYTYLNTGSQIVPANVETVLENNGNLGGLNFPIPGIPEMYDTTTFQVRPGGPELTFGDVVMSGLAFQMTTTSNNQRVEIKVVGAIGSPSENTTELTNMDFKTSGPQAFTSFFLGDGQTQDQLDYPSEFRMLSDAQVTIDFSYLFLLVIKR